MLASTSEYPNRFTDILKSDVGGLLEKWSSVEGLVSLSKREKKNERTRLNSQMSKLGL